MKSCAEWHELWSALIAEVKAPLPPLPDARNWKSRIADLDALEARDREAVDAACRRWIKEGDWPKLTDAQRYFVSLRVLHALAISTHLLPAAEGRSAWVSAPHMTDEAMCAWFLISAWPGGWIGMREQLRAVGP